MTSIWIGVRLLVLFSVYATPTLGAQRDITSVDTAEIALHARVLAADSLRGRLTGSRELKVAANYIASVCSEIGLEPLGADYLLDVPLTRAHFGEGTRLVIQIGGLVRAFNYGRDFTFSFLNASTLREFSAPAVLVGTDQQVRMIDEDGALNGAVAVTLGTVSQQASRHLADRGTVAMIHLLAETAAYTTFIRESRTMHLLSTDPLVESSFALGLPSVIASPSLSGDLYRALFSGANVTIDLRLNAREEQFVSHNVACLLEGARPRTQRRVIALTAHYDHLGVGTPDVNGDSIYNGFSDNAAGVGMLLAIARATSQTENPFGDDLAFLFFTAEEVGLIGSDYFVTNPPVPLDRFRAVINLDAGAPPAPPWNWRIAGGDSSHLGQIAVNGAISRGWSARTSPAVPNSDYFPFWRKGIPAVLIVPGVERFEGLSADSSRTLRERWDRYHQRGDEWEPGFPMSGLQRYAEYALLVARRVDEQ